MNTTDFPLTDFHRIHGARMTEVNGVPVIADYGDLSAEHHRLTKSAALVDLSTRGRLCLVGADRVRFLHGQVTNDIQRLRPGEGCYAAITNAKGKMESDLNVYCLADELLLDCEPGWGAKVTARLEKYLVADDVQIVDAAPHYGLISLVGPRAGEALRSLPGLPALPTVVGHITSISLPAQGELYVSRQLRTGTDGYDLFVPVAMLAEWLGQLLAAARALGGGLAGWKALEMARIEAGIPRYGADLDETTLPPEGGIEARAMVYNKGCYIGQEVLNRIHSFGHVNRELRRLRLPDQLISLPPVGTKLVCAGKEVGHLTSVTQNPGSRENFALGYVRREILPDAKGLEIFTPEGSHQVQICGATPGR